MAVHNRLTVPHNISLLEERLSSAIHSLWQALYESLWNAFFRLSSRANSGNSLMRWSQLYKWCLLGAWHSAVAFGGWYMAWPDAFSDAGAGLQAFGAVVAATSVLIVNLKVQHKLHNHSEYG